MDGIKKPASKQKKKPTPVKPKKKPTAKKLTTPAAAATAPQNHSNSTGSKNNTAKIILIVLGSLLMLVIVGMFLSNYIFSTILRQATGDKVKVNNNTIQLKGEDGNTTTIGKDVKLPADFPSDVTIYSGAKLIMANQGKSGTYSVSFTTKDDSVTVYKYYSENLPKSGWSPNKANSNYGAGKVLNFSKDNRQLTLIITDPTGTQKETGVGLVITNSSNSTSAQ